jgi:F-type H+-transporting ATPase subunit b|tara:strand:+ start:1120 stop:1620 length:501 start_codon:yes stop_codon:yes gene_type:complete
MDLLTPGVGLIFWQLLIFGILFLFLSKYAWGPITKSLKEREKFISDSIKSAEKAEKELEKLNDKNKELVKEARKEREKILLEAKSISNSIKNTAKEEASKITDKMIDDAKKMIEGEKMSAIKEVKVLVASLSLDIAEKVIQKNLKNESSQQKLVSDLIDKIKIEKN